MVERARPPVIDRRYSRGYHTDSSAPPFRLLEENIWAAWREIPANACFDFPVTLDGSFGIKIVETSVLPKDWRTLQAAEELFRAVVLSVAKDPFI